MQHDGLQEVSKGDADGSESIIGGSVMAFITPSGGNIAILGDQPMEGKDN